MIDNERQRNLDPGIAGGRQPSASRGFDVGRSGWSHGPHRKNRMQRAKHRDAPVSLDLTRPTTMDRGTGQAAPTTRGRLGQSSVGRAHISRTRKREPNRTPWQWILWMLALGISIAGCGPAGDALPSWSGTPCPSQTLCTTASSPVAARLRVADGCIWAETSGGEEVGILWPPGYRWRTDLSAVVAPDGHPVARPGEDFVGAVGYSSVDVIVPNSCGLDKALVIDSFSPAG